IAGWLAEQFMKSQMGLLMNIVLGIVGAAVANLLLGFIGINLTGWIGYLIAGFVGACILIAVGRALSGAVQRTRNRIRPDLASAHSSGRAACRSAARASMPRRGTGWSMASPGQGLFE